MSGHQQHTRGSLRGTLRERASASPTADESVPRGLQVASAYAWRFIVIAAAAGVLIWLIIQLRVLVIPLFIAILVTALIWPAFTWMLRHHVPRWLAIVLSVLGTLAIVSGLMYVAIWQISQQWPKVRARSVEVVGDFRDYLIEGPLHLTASQLDGFLDQAVGLVDQQAELLLSGALAIGSTLGHLATGILLAIFILLCVLTDGAGIWRWTVRLFPRRARVAVDGAGRSGWRTVVNFARTQMLVATIDAVGIGLGAFFLGVPLALPIAVLVFLGAFIPIVGAVFSGAIAVFIALIYNGPWIALWMLVVVLAVQQIEGHILQPLLMGAAVKVHPLAVVLVVAGGALLAGIPGALFAVPLAAFVNVVAVYLARRQWEHGSEIDGPDMIWRTVPQVRRSLPRRKKARS